MCWIVVLTITAFMPVEVQKVNSLSIILQLFKTKIRI
jgi:hypothetical protein